MEWNTRNYGKLIKECEIKYTKLDTARTKSDLERHCELYPKRDKEGFTDEVEQEIQSACDFEDDIKTTLNEISKLKKDVITSLDKLKACLDAVKI